MGTSCWACSRRKTFRPSSCCARWPCSSRPGRNRGDGRITRGSLCHHAPGGAGGRGIRRLVRGPGAEARARRSDGDRPAQLSFVPATVISSGHRRPVARRNRFAGAPRAKPAAQRARVDGRGARHRRGTPPRVSGRWRGAIRHADSGHRFASSLFRSPRLGAAGAGTQDHRRRHGDPPPHSAGVRMRRARILLAFECAEREPDTAERRAWLTFAIVGAGPTGVELAGALGGIANDTLRHDFRSITPAEAAILLVEGADRVLPSFPPDLSAAAERALSDLGVRARTHSTVTGLDRAGVTIRTGDSVERIPAKTVLWAAGVEASELGKIVSQRTGAPLDRAGRVIVEPDLTVPGHPEIFVIGDLAHFSHQTGQPLPGVAPVAMAQGRYVARAIRARLRGETAP